MAEAPQPAVFYGGLGRLARIQFHHPAIFIARQAKGIAEALQPLAIEAEGALRRQRRGAIGIHLLHHVGVDVFLRRQHRAPGRLAAGAIGEAADHPIPQAVVVAEALAAAEHRGGGAAGAQLLVGAAPASQAGDAAIKAAWLVAPAAIAIAIAPNLSDTDAQVGHGGLGHRKQGPAQGIRCRQGGQVDAAPAAGQGRL